MQIHHYVAITSAQMSMVSIIKKQTKSNSEIPHSSNKTKHKIIQVTNTLTLLKSYKAIETGLMNWRG